MRTIRAGSGKVRATPLEKGDHSHRLAQEAMGTVVEKKPGRRMRNGIKPAQSAAVSEMLNELNLTVESGARKLGISISPPNFPHMQIGIASTAPYCQNRWSVKAQEQMRATQEAGSTGKKGKQREKKDFKAAYEEAQYISREGWHGIPAASFRKACISACRVVGFKMAHAKLGLFIVPDGFDARDGTPLVKLNGKPQMRIHPVRNDNGSADLRARAFFDEWSAELTVRYDADMFTAQDIVNLLMRAGMQVGIGEGRPDSKESSGMDWGLFRLVEEKAEEK